MDRSDAWQYRLVGAQVIRFVASWSLRDWEVAVVAVFASLLLSPRASEATCGDYLHIGDRSVTLVHSLPNQPTSTDGSSDNSDYMADPSVPHRPCQGPSCSGGSFPPQAPVAGVVVSIERWALASADAVQIVVCCDHLLVEPFDLVADGYRLSILRPPS